MNLPGDRDQFANEDCASVAKLLGLLAIVLFGCVCWIFVWQRELARSRSPGKSPVWSSESDVRAAEIAQQVTNSLNVQR